MWRFRLNKKNQREIKCDVWMALKWGFAKNSRHICAWSISETPIFMHCVKDEYWEKGKRESYLKGMHMALKQWNKLCRCNSSKMVLYKFCWCKKHVKRRLNYNHIRSRKARDIFSIGGHSFDIFNLVSFFSKKQLCAHLCLELLEH